MIACPAYLCVSVCLSVVHVHYQKVLGRVGADCVFCLFVLEVGTAAATAAIMARSRLISAGLAAFSRAR